MLHCNRWMPMIYRASLNSTAGGLRRLGLDFPMLRDMDMPGLAELFMEAAETNRAMPPATRKRKLTSWPEYSHDWLSYADDETHVTIRPSTAQVTRWEQAIYISRELPELDRRLIWLVSISAAYRERGPNWRRLGRLLHMDGRTVKRRYKDALLALYYRI
jgi:ribosomal protein L20